MTLSNEHKFQGMRFWNINTEAGFIGQLSCAPNGWNKWAVLAGETYKTFSSKDKALAFAATL